MGSLAFLGFSFVTAWGRAAPFDPGAIAVDVGLFTAFATHHSVFAREPVQRWLMRLIPQRLLRSAYVWLASLLLILLCAAWRPVGGEAYHVRGWLGLVHAALQLAGVAIIVSAVRAIDALELAGIRPLAEAGALQMAGPYGWVRHPLYLGWLLATFGPAHMTGDRLTFSGIAAIYLLIAVPFEERSLARVSGEQYERYRKRVRWRVVPYVY